MQFQSLGHGSIDVHGAFSHRSPTVMEDVTSYNIYIVEGTYTNTRNICPHMVKKRDHVLALCDSALKTRVESVSRKEGED